MRKKDFRRLPPRNFRLKRECLNYFMCFNEDQLDYICLRRSRSERVAVQL
jgi:hypothetical protein